MSATGQTTVGLWPCCRRSRRTTSLAQATNVVGGNTFSRNWKDVWTSAALIVGNLFTVTNPTCLLANQATGPNAAALGLSVYLLPEDLPSAQVANNTLYNNVGGAAMTFEDWDESVSAVINNVVVSNTLAITTEKDSARPVGPQPVR
ncbi:MAG: hypothetical protein U0X20_11370 [Caldilineaceae bacterium]